MQVAGQSASRLELIWDRRDAFIGDLRPVFRGAEGSKAFHKSPSQVTVAKSPSQDTLTSHVISHVHVLTSHSHNHLNLRSRRRKSSSSVILATLTQAIL